MITNNLAHDERKIIYNFFLICIRVFASLPSSLPEFLPQWDYDVRARVLLTFLMKPRVFRIMRVGYRKLDTLSSFTTLRRQHSQLFRAFLTVARRPLSNVQRRCLASFKLARPLSLVSCSVLSLEYLMECLY